MVEMVAVGSFKRPPEPEPILAPAELYLYIFEWGGDDC